MAAAVRAKESGASVTLLDDNAAPGGQIWRGGEQSHAGSQSAQWYAQFRRAAITVFNGVQVISANPASRTVLVETPQDAFELEFRKLILATGAREIFLPFPGWTLPGIMGVGGIQALAKAGMPVSGKIVVIAGSGPLLLAVASYLREHGARVTLVAEQAPRNALARFAAQLLRSPGKIAQAAALKLSLRGIPYRAGCWIEEAEGSARLERVRLRCGNKSWTENCDLAAIAYGLCPNIELATLLGCRHNRNAVVVDEFQRSSVEDVFCAGECTGIGGVDLSLVEGEVAGYAAAGRKERARALFSKRKSAARFADALQAAFTLREELKRLPHPDTMVCRCEDVTFRRLQGMQSFRAAKLHTRCGMGPCQGRICGPAGDFLFGWRTESIRPPIFPARMGSLMVQENITEEASIPQ